MNIKDIRSMQDTLSLNGVRLDVTTLKIIANSLGYVVRHIGKWDDNLLGKTNIIVIENGQYRIAFITNVLNGRNYFQLYQVYDYLADRVYKNGRYMMKFISIVSDITGKTHIQLKGGN